MFFLNSSSSCVALCFVRGVVMTQIPSILATRNPDEWFASMLPWLLQYAQLSAANNVDMLCIGVEFLHMTGAAYTTRWLAIAAAVRQVFSGQLTYSSLFVREWYTIEWWSGTLRGGSVLHDARGCAALLLDCWLSLVWA